MDILDRKQDCCGCHACVNACPVQAVHMQYDAEGFLYPAVDKSRCIACEKCRAVCPILHMPAVSTVIESWACQTKDLAVRLRSSSGGIFATLAGAVLHQGGLVCGAAYTEDLSAVHLIISRQSELKKLQGTKYVQSTVGDCYSRLAAHLISGKTVLFSGTPCQVAGLRSYLGQDYENLLTLDLICHGVPSPRIWQQYLSLLGDVCEIDLRRKDPKTGKEMVYIRRTNGEEIYSSKTTDLYMKGFLQNLYLRPSCLECRFKGLQRCSDITIGDFWSIRETHPAMADGFGSSAVLIHSRKGQAWLQTVCKDLNMEQATVAQIATWNDCLMKPAAANPKRQEFHLRRQAEPLLPLLESLTQAVPAAPKPTVLARIRRKLRAMLAKEAYYG